MALIYNQAWNIKNYRYIGDVLVLSALSPLRRLAPTEGVWSCESGDLLISSQFLCFWCDLRSNSSLTIYDFHLWRWYFGTLAQQFVYVYYKKLYYDNLYPALVM